MKNVSTIQRFPVGYHKMHEDVSLNFQLNRWYNWIGDESALEELKQIVSKVGSYAEWIEEFTKAGEAAEKRGEDIKAGFYYRSAEFFVLYNDPRRQVLRKKALELWRKGYNIKPEQLFKIPYGKGHLPGYRFDAKNPKLTIVVHGGFDSYIEEFITICMSLQEAGYTVISFEGPGQGGALNDYDLKMDEHWHKPVTAVMDYFDLKEAALMGISLGGNLCIRAAAYEKRIKYVIADDVMFDTFECAKYTSGAGQKKMMETIDELVNAGEADKLNSMLEEARKKSLILDWTLFQSMHIFGADSPYDQYVKGRRLNASDVSKLVDQHVLCLAGQHDHFVPLKILSEQMLALENAKSVTGRIFTPYESGQNHCQIGNIRLQLETILNWLDFTMKHS